MKGELPEIGKIEPIVEQVGWKVCKKSAEDEKEQEWIPVKEYAIAEILSCTIKQQNREK
ncbi:MAG TPA: hypothetical protein VFG01_08615 [Acidobacteriota bacterium]|nr:hypothetical protein [Acidobacteriota bacterium]